MQGAAVIHKNDLGELLDAIFVGVKVEVFEAYSEMGEQICCFHDGAELHRCAESKLISPKEHLQFAIRYEDAGPAAIITKVSLDPRRCRGHSFRYRVDGWGMISLQFDIRKFPLLQCRIAVHTKKRALAIHASSTEGDHPDEWDWKFIEKQARRLIRVLKRLGERDVGDLVAT